MAFLSHRESRLVVTTFRVFVCRRFRATLSSGFLQGEHWSLLNTPAFILAFFGYSLSVRFGYSALTKVTRVLVACSCLPAGGKSMIGLHLIPLSFPLHPIDDHSPGWGKRISWFTSG